MSYNTIRVHITLDSKDNDIDQKDKLEQALNITCNELQKSLDKPNYIGYKIKEIQDVS